ncbi:MAG TPA: hypothetical protein VGS12_18720 [Caulobacteraceae bacterium]|nr:hypothetical protein [Caulobacteraceae bacterium]
MVRHSFHDRARRWCFLAVILAALVARIGAPPGFMTEASADGAPALVLCTGHGPVRTLADLGRVTPGKTFKPGCWLAHAIGAAPGASSPAPPAYFAWRPVPRPPPAVLVWSGQRAASPPPARAPPRLSI